MNKKLPTTNYSLLTNKGIVMVEIIVVITVISISLLALISVSKKAVQVSRNSLNKIQASFLLEEGVEVIKIIRDNDWDNISNLSFNSDYYLSFSSGSWSLSSSANLIDNFTRIITVENVNRDSNDDIAVSGTIDPGTKLITVSVSWPDGNQTINESLQFYLLNIFE